MKLSVLVSARKNSKYLARFLFGYLDKTAKRSDIEVLVMLNEGDTWNRDLVAYFDGLYNIKFFYEDKKLGRAGLHEYFNDLYEQSKGKWIIYFCEDHLINTPNWDVKVRNLIINKNLSHNDIWCIVPKFDNAGAMNHILSRAFIECMGGYLARHGNLDSYINDVCRELLDNRTIRMDDELFHDFTHDKPSPMSDAAMQGVVTEKAAAMPKYDNHEVTQMVIDDGEKLKRHLELRNEHGLHS